MANIEHQINTLLNALANAISPEDIATISGRVVELVNANIGIATKLAANEEARELLSQAINVAGGAITSRTAEVAAAQAAGDINRPVYDIVRRQSPHWLTPIYAEVKRNVKNNVDFVLITALRGYDFNRRVGLVRRRFRTFAKTFDIAMRDAFMAMIRDNVVGSFKQGGPLADDVEKKASWDPLSKHTVKRKGHSRLGVDSAGMVRNLYRIGRMGSAIKINFPKDGDLGKTGAREFIVDFSNSKWGEKLARFYFGRTKHGFQPERKFTFLTKGNLREFGAITHSALDDYANDLYTLFAGIHVGKLPRARIVGGAPRIRKPEYAAIEV